jgi:molecular chaperone GrpE
VLDSLAQGGTLPCSGPHFERALEVQEPPHVRDLVFVNHLSVCLKPTKTKPTWAPLTNQAPGGWFTPRHAGDGRIGQGTDGSRIAGQERRLADQYLRAKARLTTPVAGFDEGYVLKARRFAVEAFAESLLPVADSPASLTVIKDGTLSNSRRRSGHLATTALLRLSAKVIAIDPLPKCSSLTHITQATQWCRRSWCQNSVVAKGSYSIADRVMRPALVTALRLNK